MLRTLLCMLLLAPIYAVAPSLPQQSPQPPPSRPPPPNGPLSPSPGEALVPPVPARRRANRSWVHVGCGLRPAQPTYLTTMRQWMADVQKPNADEDIGFVDIVPQPPLATITQNSSGNVSVSVLGQAEYASLDLLKMRARGARLNLTQMNNDVLAGKPLPSKYLVPKPGTAGGPTMVPLLLFYRRDWWQQLTGLSADEAPRAIPVTWEGFVKLLTQLQDRDVNGDGQREHEHVLCVDMMPGCKGWALLSGIYASYLQTRGAVSSGGLWLNPSSGAEPLRDRIGGAAMAAALQTYGKLASLNAPLTTPGGTNVTRSRVVETLDELRKLSGSAPAGAFDNVTGEATCGAINGLFTSGRCLFTIDWASAALYLDRTSSAATSGRLAVAQLPGSTVVQDQTERTALAHCNSDNCPRANHYLVTSLALPAMPPMPPSPPSPLWPPYAPRMAATDSPVSPPPVYPFESGAPETLQALSDTEISAEWRISPYGTASAAAVEPLRMFKYTLVDSSTPAQGDGGNGSVVVVNRAPLLAEATNSWVSSAAVGTDEYNQTETFMEVVGFNLGLRYGMMFSAAARTTSSSDSGSPDELNDPMCVSSVGNMLMHLVVPTGTATTSAALALLNMDLEDIRAVAVEATLALIDSNAAYDITLPYSSDYRSILDNMALAALWTYNKINNNNAGGVPNKEGFSLAPPPPTPPPPPPVPAAWMSPWSDLATNGSAGFQEIFSWFPYPAILQQIYFQSFEPSDTNMPPAGSDRNLLMDVGLPVAISLGVTVVVMLLVTVVLWRLYRARRLRAVRPPGPGPATTMIFSDVQNSTLLWEVLPSGVMDVCLAIHHAVIRKHIRENRGFELFTEGDAFAVAFSCPSDALAFALDTQAALLDADWPPALLEQPDGCEVWAQAVAGAPTARLDMPTLPQVPSATQDLSTIWWRETSPAGPLTVAVRRTADGAAAAAAAGGGGAVNGGGAAGGAGAAADAAARAADAGAGLAGPTLKSAADIRSCTTPRGDGEGVGVGGDAATGDASANGSVAAQRDGGEGEKACANVIPEPSSGSRRTDGGARDTVSAGARQSADRPSSSSAVTAAATGASGRPHPAHLGLVRIDVAAANDAPMPDSGAEDAVRGAAAANDEMDELLMPTADWRRMVTWDTGSQLHHSRHTMPAYVDAPNGADAAAAAAAAGGGGAAAVPPAAVGGVPAHARVAALRPAMIRMSLSVDRRREERVGRRVSTPTEGAPSRSITGFARASALLSWTPRFKPRGGSSPASGEASADAVGSPPAAPAGAAAAAAGPGQLISGSVQSSAASGSAPRAGSMARVIMQLAAKSFHRISGSPLAVEGGGATGVVHSVASTPINAPEAAMAAMATAAATVAAAAAATEIALDVEAAVPLPASASAPQPAAATVAAAAATAAKAPAPSRPPLPSPAARHWWQPQLHVRRRRSLAAGPPSSWKAGSMAAAETFSRSKAAGERFISHLVGSTRGQPVFDALWHNVNAVGAHLLRGHNLVMSPAGNTTTMTANTNAFLNNKSKSNANANAKVASTLGGAAQGAAINRKASDWGFLAGGGLGLSVEALLRRLYVVCEPAGAQSPAQSPAAAAAAPAAGGPASNGRPLQPVPSGKGFSERVAATAPEAPRQLVLRGLRVRMGMNSDLKVHEITTTMRDGVAITMYTGDFLATCKDVADAAMGGVVLLSGHAFQRYQELRQEDSERQVRDVMLLNLGEHVIHAPAGGGVGDASPTVRAMPTSAADADGGAAAIASVSYQQRRVLYCAVSPSLAPRLGVLPALIRTNRQLIPGCLSAPAGAVAPVFCNVVGIETLLAWEKVLLHHLVNREGSAGSTDTGGGGRRSWAGTGGGGTGGGGGGGAGSSGKHLKEAYTSLESQGSAPVTAAIELLRRIANDAAARLGGYVVAVSGDGGHWVLVFGSPESAVRWGLEVLEAMLTAAWPEGLLEHELTEEVWKGGVLTKRGLRLRIGVDYGRAMVRLVPRTGKLDYVGRPMNRAARIAAKAKAATILVSGAVWEAVQPSLRGRVVAKSLGPTQLKGVQEQLELLALSWAAPDSSSGSESAILLGRRRTDRRLTSGGGGGGGGGIAGAGATVGFLGVDIGLSTALQDLGNDLVGACMGGLARGLGTGEQ